jgi:PilZ domain
LSERQTVLILPLEGRLDDVSGRLLLVHYRGRLVPDLAEADRLLRTEKPPIRVALIASEPGVTDLTRTLQALRTASPGRQLRFIAIGPRPSEAQRTKLLNAGVDWALYDAFTDTELRFVLNRALHDSHTERRDELRVPTTMVAKVKTTTGTKVAMVYNLSTGGAYLETMRPSQVGIKVSVEMPLPWNTLDIPAEVVSTNVTGNLRKENLPRGMGVKFIGLSKANEMALAKYVDERAAAFRP